MNILKKVLNIFKTSKQISKQINNLKISDKGINFISNFEGKRYKMYKDAAGLPTIGIGHLIKPNEKELLTKTLTENEVNELFRNDLKGFENAVNNSVKVSLNQNQYDALVSFSFNVGIGSFQGSTLLKLLNAGKYSEAAEQFQRWNKAGGKPIYGLTRRRNEEKQLFLIGDYKI